MCQYKIYVIKIKQEKIETRFKIILIPLTHSQHDEVATLNTRSRGNKHATLDNRKKQIQIHTFIHFINYLQNPSLLVNTTMCGSTAFFFFWLFTPSFTPLTQHQHHSFHLWFGKINKRKEKKSYLLLLFLRKSLFCQYPMCYILVIPNITCSKVDFAVCTLVRSQGGLCCVTKKFWNFDDHVMNFTPLYYWVTSFVFKLDLT